jgi:hypothetical protein
MKIGGKNWDVEASVRDDYGLEGGTSKFKSSWRGAKQGNCGLKIGSTVTGKSFYKQTSTRMLWGLRLPYQKQSWLRSGSGAAKRKHDGLRGGEYRCPDSQGGGFTRE